MMLLPFSMLILCLIISCLFVEGISFRLIPISHYQYHHNQNWKESTPESISRSPCSLSGSSNDLSPTDEQPLNQNQINQAATLSSTLLGYSLCGAKSALLSFALAHYFVQYSQTEFGKLLHNLGMFSIYSTKKLQNYLQEYQIKEKLEETLLDITEDPMTVIKLNQSIDKVKIWTEKKQITQKSQEWIQQFGEISDTMIDQLVEQERKVTKSLLISLLFLKSKLLCFL